MDMRGLVKLFLFITFVTTSLFAESGKVLTFELPTLDGKVIKVKERKNGLQFLGFEGKVVLLEFWGTRCPPCLHSINHYKRLTQEYKDKVEMVAIEVQATPKDVLKRFVARKGINYHVVAQEDARDFVNYVAARAGWRGAIPFLIVLDKNGDVLDIRKGYADANYVKKAIEIGLQDNPQTSH
jgi:thiol-disulfide isomerase/thioredoxin